MAIYIKSGTKHRPLIYTCALAYIIKWRFVCRMEERESLYPPPTHIHTYTHAGTTFYPQRAPTSESVDESPMGCKFPWGGSGRRKISLSEGNICPCTSICIYIQQGRHNNILVVPRQRPRKFCADARHMAAMGLSNFDHHRASFIVFYSLFFCNVFFFFFFWKKWEKQENLFFIFTTCVFFFLSVETCKVNS